jgi:hypothetical protein
MPASKPKNGVGRQQLNHQGYYNQVISVSKSVAVSVRLRQWQVVKKIQSGENRFAIDRMVA